MFLTDSVTASNVRRTADGYLVADAKVARTGIQEYLGSEVGKPDMPIVRVYRPESSVFADSAMRSYAYRPMTNDHPGGEGVNSKNWKDVAIGQTGSEVLRDGEFVRVPLVLMDAKAIADYESGKRELSMGYGAELTFQDGVTDKGEAYDAILGPMTMNHLALVDRARGGEHLRIGDTKQPNPTGGHDMADVLRKLLVDGLTIEVTEQGAQAIEKLNGKLADAATATKTLADAHAVALAGKDDEIVKIKAALDDAKTKILSDAQVDALVKDRTDLVTIAKALHDGDYTGKSADEIRKAVVVAKFGDAAVAGQPEAYIKARFDILAEDAAKNPGSDTFRQHMIHQDGKTVGNESDQARQQMITDMQTAHLPKA
ncbi:DUF2213 domain-containing protein [Pseudomonas syringae]|uniref:DUF2213 domain-containing protein n=1 Tax=Pseudomonas syringae TaxID=317 RepID=A0A085V3X4_PSESX|nr:DUF2213 domain-containing protein [Pseudomonas syringae]KFE50137.1 hypothetical protein IV01_26045 [Pseudomonas syringae]